FPLAPSLDSIGPLANSVACCRSLDAVLASEEPLESAGMAASDLRLGVVTNYVMDGLDTVVASSYERALRALNNAGAHLSDLKLPELSELPGINRKGGLPSAEAYAHHRTRLGKDAAQYDQRVSTRMLRAREQDAADYIELQNYRTRFIERVSERI